MYVLYGWICCTESATKRNVGPYWALGKSYTFFFDYNFNDVLLLDKSKCDNKREIKSTHTAQKHRYRTITVVDEKIVER